MKDYFDLWLLSRQSELNKAILRKIIETFENRKIVIETKCIGSSETFGADPAKQPVKSLSKTFFAHGSGVAPFKQKAASGAAS